MIVGFILGFILGFITRYNNIIQFAIGIAHLRIMLYIVAQTRYITIYNDVNTRSTPILRLRLRRPWVRIPPGAPEKPLKYTVYCVFWRFFCLFQKSRFRSGFALGFIACLHMAKITYTPRSSLVLPQHPALYRRAFRHMPPACRDTSDCRTSSRAFR